MPCDLWALWPDDFMCPLPEKEVYMRPPCARSDDYMVVEVALYGPDGDPLEWKRYEPRQAKTPAPNA